MSLFAQADSLIRIGVLVFKIVSKLVIQLIVLSVRSIKIISSFG